MRVFLCMCVVYTCRYCRCMYVCIYGCVESVDYVCMDGELGSTLPSFAAIAPFSPYKTDKVGIIICSRHYTTTGAAYELPEYKLISLLSRHSLFCPSPSPQLSSRPLFTYLWWRHLSREEKTLASEMRLWRKYRNIAGSVSVGAAPGTVALRHRTTLGVTVCSLIQAGMVWSRTCSSIGLYLKT